MGLPFTWDQLTDLHERPINGSSKDRIIGAIRAPNRWWPHARSVIVAGHLGMRSSTLWQCVEAVTLKRFPDGGDVPDPEEIVAALCFAAGEPYPGRGRWSV